MEVKIAFHLKQMGDDEATNLQKVTWNRRQLEGGATRAASFWLKFDHHAPTRTELA